MKDYEANIVISAECEADARELIEGYTGKETDVRIKSVSEGESEEWDGKCPKCGCEDDIEETSNDWCGNPDYTSTKSCNECGCTFETCIQSTESFIGET